MFTTTLASNAPFPLYVVCQQRFGFSPTTLTYVFSSYAVGVIVVPVPVLVLVGRLSDQIGRRRVIIPALILLATGPLLFGILVQYAPWPLRLPFVVEVALVTATVTLTRTVPETVKRGPSVRWRVQKPAVPRPIRRAFVAATLALAVSWGVGALYAALSPSIDLQLLRVRSHAAAGAVLAAFFGLGGVAQTLFRAWPARSRWSPELAHSQAAWRSSHVASPTAQWRSSSPGRFSLVPVAGWTSWGAWPCSTRSVRRSGGLRSSPPTTSLVTSRCPSPSSGGRSRALGLQRASEIFTAMVVAVSTVFVGSTMMLPSEPVPRLSDDGLGDPRLERSKNERGSG